MYILLKTLDINYIVTRNKTKEMLKVYRENFVCKNHFQIKRQLNSEKPKSKL